ncbi:hypothetical protein FRB99_000351 [Tulasnella sp. 403]|nr:hypothetical protein FRB99_000351 [Tulasnella sp. 403]
MSAGVANGKKRPEMGLDTSNIVDGPRKRRKDSANHTGVEQMDRQTNSKSPSPQPQNPPARKITLRIKKQTDAGTQETTGARPLKDSDAVERGMKLWNAVKLAKDSDGRPLSVDFLKLPSKRQYPDYYVFIKQPISLEEIKAKLDTNSYGSFKAVKTDFDIMFTNAKQYNMPESQIWHDADDLHNLVIRDYTSLAGDDADTSDEMLKDSPNAEATDDKSDAANGKNVKSQRVTLQRLLKTRLQKLLKKKDSELVPLPVTQAPRLTFFASSGRSYVAAFMEIPSKRDYPTYTKIIRKPMTFSQIEKRVDRREYSTVQNFVNDVEQIFTNAFIFNEEYSPVWNDAKFLQDAFRTLMSDLPPPFTLPVPAQTEQSSTKKLRLKVTQPAGTTTSANSPAATSQAAAVEPTKPAPSPKPVPTPVPALAPPPAVAAKASTPIAPRASTPATKTSTPVPQAAPAASTSGPPTAAYQTSANAPTSYPSQLIPQYQAAGYNYFNFPPHVQQQMHHAYAQQAQGTSSQSHTPAAAPSPAPTPAVPPTTAAPAVAAAPKPLPIKYIKRLAIRTSPAGRRVKFENVEGLDLRFWSMRLGGRETGVELIDLEVYERALIPPGSKRVKDKPKGKGKAKAADDEGMDVDEEDDDEEDGEGESDADEDDAGAGGKAKGEGGPEVEVKVNSNLLKAIALPAPPLPPESPSSPTEPKPTPNGVMANGNGHPNSDPQSDSELTDEEPSTNAKGRALRGRLTRSAKNRKAKPSKASKGNDRMVQYQEPPIRMERKRWETALSIGNNILDVKVGASTQSETWRIFIERVV